MFWGEHDPGLFEGTERFFRPNYVQNLIGSWIPALDSAEEKLRSGAIVADVGCGHGASTVLMARAFPKSRFFGFDNHAPSIARARQSADEAGLFTQVTFEVAPAVSFPGHGYDLIAFFDCLHDMGDPVGALRHAHEAMAKDGTVLLVEPAAGEKIEENLNPIGRVYSGASVLCCAPNAIASGNVVLGTIASEADFRKVAKAAGFSKFRVAAATPLNRVFELRA
jgi:SAM-dependent methyltransferase